MALKIKQSSLEILAYLALLTIVVAVAVEIPIFMNIVHQQRAEQDQIRKAVLQIEQNDNCLVSFFLQPNRLNITLQNLPTFSKSCSAAVKQLP